jgi:glycosyltransferase involved in cell wall biosynthesis
MAKSVCFLSLKHPFDDNRVLIKEACTLAREGYRVTHVTPGTGSSGPVMGVHIQFFRSAAGRFRALKNALTLLGIGLRIDADYYHCNEIESWMIGCVIKLLRKGKKVVFDVHEHYPSRFSEPHFPRWLGPVGSPLVHLVIRCLTPFTDHLIFAKLSVAPDYRGAGHKSTFLFNYAPLRLRSRSRDDVPAGLEERFGGRQVAVHIGVISRVRGWPQMLQAMSLMENRDLIFVNIGPVSEGRETLMAEAERLGVGSRVVLIDHLPYDEMFDYLFVSSMGLMLYQPGIVNHVFAFPMKMYDYMLAGLPVICPGFAVEAEPVIREERCGLLVDTDRPGDIALAMDFLCDNPAEAGEMGKRGREAVLRKYNWESEEGKLIGVYRAFDRSAAGCSGTGEQGLTGAGGNGYIQG